MRLLYDAGDCPNANPKRDCVSYTYGDSYGHSYIHTDSYSYVHAYSHSHSYIHPYSYIHAYSYSHSYVHTDGDGNVYPNAYCVSFTYGYSDSYVHTYADADAYVCDCSDVGSQRKRHQRHDRDDGELHPQGEHDLPRVRVHELQHG